MREGKFGKSVSWEVDEKLQLGVGVGFASWGWVQRHHSRLSKGIALAQSSDLA